VPVPHNVLYLQRDKFVASTSRTVEKSIQVGMQVKETRKINKATRNNYIMFSVIERRLVFEHRTC